MDFLRKTRTAPAAAPLLRPANDSLRPLSTVELALEVRSSPTPVGREPVWRLHPQYEAWLAERFPRDPVWFCPLDLYDREVRGPDAQATLEELHARLVAQTDGFPLQAVKGVRRRTAMFAIGGHRLKALTEFLFAWG